ncbi:drug:proton antiporter [candidate division GN15 bacterium]|uniref:Drug:proton antiporter n=1 Tax=candidate division GN15 bacterium TaxID=2072418 RepID=A0A855X8N5_9BACT|nr:MAG: drug:proton antiporter [candidate division GN15 bacterium]
MTTQTWRSFRSKLIRDYPQLQPEHPSFRWLVLAGVMIATFMAVLDATIVNVALPKLMASFGVTVDQVEWVLTAYLLVFGVMLPISGWLADHIGYKLIFTLGLLLFTFSSFMCSLAWDFNVLIFWRVLQGAGSGILMPVGMAIITREFPPEKRGIALAFWSMSASASVSLGPAIGGYLIDNFSWHTIFDVNVPVGIIGMAAAVIILREHKAANSRAFDVVGGVSLAAFLTSLLLALANGNSAWNTGGWTSNYILTCFAISAVSIVVFLVTEFTVEHPLIELNLFKDFNFAVCNVVLFLFGLGMFGSTFLLPIYLQDSLDYTPLQAGLVFLPVGVMQGLVAPLAGWYSDRFSPKLPSILGVVVMAFTFYQFSTLSLFSERHEIMVPLVLRGAAMGVLFAPLMAMAISGISHQKMAQASGLLNVVRQIGGSFGVAVFGTLLTRRTIYHMTTYGEQVNANSDSFRATVIRLQSWATHVAGSSFGEAAAQAKAQIGMFVANQAFIQAVDDVFLLAGVIVLIGVVPLFMVRTRKRRALLPASGRPAPVQVE